MRSRLAPSPTGALHLGNARTSLLTWLHVRAAGGACRLRIDDLDGPRVKRGAEAGALEDLRWLGLGWDEAEGGWYRRSAARSTPRRPSAWSPGAWPTPARARAARWRRGQRAARAQEGPRYPGTCRGRSGSLAPAAATRPSGRLRFRAREGPVRFTDEVLRRPGLRRGRRADDFVIFKNNGTAAYQLATVVDDAAWAWIS